MLRVPRIPRDSCIVSKVREKLKKLWCNLHDSPIFQEERLVITLRFLVTGNSYSALSFDFMIGISTGLGIVRECLDVLWSIFQPVHMPVPTMMHFMKISNDFLVKWGVPNCIGAMDGKHVRIKKPADSGSLYYNYKHYFSSVLQATVDANGKFVTIEVYKFGSQSDGSIFNASKLVLNIHQDTTIDIESEYLEDEEVKEDEEGEEEDEEDEEEEEDEQPADDSNQNMQQVSQAQKGALSRSILIEWFNRNPL
ncbi:hypothetical protein TKK_0010139 [Trichogramma kaykai]